MTRRERKKRKKEIMVNKMWYAMWWQYVYHAIAVFVIILGIIASVVEHTIAMLIILIPVSILFYKMGYNLLMVGDEYRLKHPRYSERK